MSKNTQRKESAFENGRAAARQAEKENKEIQKEYNRTSGLYNRADFAYFRPSTSGPLAMTWRAGWYAEWDKINEAAKRRR